MPRLYPTLAALLLSTAPAMADRVSVLVFDASGSMWNRVEGDLTRIEVARDVMGDYFASRDGAVPLSVIAYGHNRRGDCRDIEVVAPMGQTAPGTLETRLRGLMPRGMTPLTDSLALARDQIPPAAEGADIILVTDGLETCGGDPCALAASLANEGIDIRAHVVGFGLSAAEVAALSCITDQTGGMLFQTNSGAELAQALQQVSAVVPAPEAPPEPAPPTAAFDIGDRAEAGFTYTITWNGTAGPTDQLGFVPQGETRAPASSSFGTINTSGPGVARNPVTRTAPATPGLYDLIIRSTSGEVIARQEIEVVPPSMGFDPIGSVEPGSRVRFTFRAPERGEERIVIADLDQPVNEHQRHSWAFSLSRNGTVTLRVPDVPGEYELRYLNRERTEVMFSRRFGVGIPFSDSDLTTSAELAARAAAAMQGDASQDDLALVTATFRLPPGLPFDSANWRAEPLDPDLPPERVRIDGTGPVVTATLQPGRWRIIAEGMADTILSAEVEIFPGQPNDFTVEMESMQVDGALTGDWTLWALPPEGIADAPMNFARISLRPTAEGMDYTGSFQTTAAMGGVQSGDLQSVTIDNDGLLEIIMVLPLGAGPETLRLALMQPLGGAGFEGQLIARTGVFPIALLPEGTPPPERQGSVVPQGNIPVDAEIVARCDTPGGCAVTIGTVSLILPEGWAMTEPLFFRAVGHAIPSDWPMASFYGPAMGELLQLNPHQWLTSNGPCLSTQAGALCWFADAPPPAITAAAMIASSLTMTAPAPSSMAVEGSVTVSLFEADITAGSGGFFPIDIAAPPGFAGMISLHDPSGGVVFSMDAAQMLSAQDYVLPVPPNPGPHEIRVIDNTGMLRATTGFFANAAPAGAPATSEPRFIPIDLGGRDADEVIDLLFPPN
ncbi:vWA domain-containing protein [Roseicyclus mahoneyensis]|uniref:VWFA domain-containing protein n=1 Tax=Roseicyclus mahoneyensis TaxID=164332 RepID=A0A316GF89_9RHOB|nr:VWA domain-containing protein [Roseicyclus mahoneyensis]PWK59616.1 hypothetical protein C7455_107161 [Roseicyclus mahoneyensis]